MKSNAGLESLSEYAKRFLELLMLPSPVLERDSPYERKETPYCHPHQSEDQESLAVVFSEEARNSTSMGGEDNYHRSNWYNLPNKLITELLTNIRPGGRRTCAVGWVEVFKEITHSGMIAKSLTTTCRIGKRRSHFLPNYQKTKIRRACSLRNGTRHG